MYTCWFREELELYIRVMFGDNMAGTIISGVIYGFVALFMFGIGISQLKSKDPVGFYTGEKPPEKERLSDINAWNKKHGTMWIVYGFCIVCSWICSAFIGESICSIIPLFAGVIAPIVLMIIYHHKLVKKYYIK